MTGDRRAARRVMAARIIAEQRWPYVASLLFSLRLVEVDPAELPTMAVDTSWRLYYSPEFVMRCSPEQLATIVLHECQHLMLEHAERFKTVSRGPDTHHLWNIAGDVVINATLADQDMPWPPHTKGLRYSHFSRQGVRAGMTTEAAYNALVNHAEKPKRKPTRVKPGSGPSSGGSGTSSAADAKPSGPAGPDSPTGSSRDPDEDEAPTPAKCGSGAGGPAAPYELPVDDPDAPGASETERAVALGRVAQDALRRAAAGELVSSSVLRWATDLSESTIDWRSLLARVMRRGIATVSGRRDYTYRMPSRRAHGLREALGGAVLPAMRQPPPPRVAAIIDTSGSIAQAEMQAFLAEVLGMVRRVGLPSGVTVIPCDARAYEPVRIRSTGDALRVQLPGGGGTNMGAGLVAACALRQTPDVVVVLTDGLTPWPAEPPKSGPTFIAAIYASPEWAPPPVPDWLTTISIDHDIAASGGW